MPRKKASKPASERQRPKKPPSVLNLEIMARLEALRAELGYTHEKMADELGVGRTTWTNWLNGENMPEEEAMLRLWRVGGVDMEWIYRGKIDRLVISHAIRLTARLKGMDPDAATVAVLIEDPKPPR